MTRSLEEMVARWADIANRAATYDLTLDDWLNDLDLRDMIGRRIAEAPAADDDLRSRLNAADRVFRESTRDAKRSLWGPNAGAEHHSTRQWWYFRYPSSPGSSMRRDLDAAGILPTTQR